ncbi:MAG: CDP-diacylglycerol diphosphatase [Candidatus Acidiferrales bacterium]
MLRSRTTRVCAGAVALCAAIAWVAAAAPQEINRRDVLWEVVNLECVPSELQSHDPKPCAEVVLKDGVDKGFAVLKDIKGLTQVLLIPTGQISGIESPIVRAPDAPNYFADAWDARTFVEDALHQKLARGDIGLAINSAAGRSQDQLHIHVDCVRADVRDTLRAEAGSIGERWAPLDVLLSGHRYEAMWVTGEALGANNPFRLLADGLPGAAQDMGDRTLVVIGVSRADGTAGFVILEDQGDRNTGNLAEGEELLDHGCRVAAAAQPSK